MEYLSHKTADLILDHDFMADPVLSLYGHNWSPYFESLVSYVTKAAKYNRCRLLIKINPGGVTIRRLN